MEHEDYSVFFTVLPNNDWWEALCAFSRWDAEGYEVKQKWADDNRSLVWYIPDKPEEGMVVYTP